MSENKLEPIKHNVNSAYRSTDEAIAFTRMAGSQEDFRDDKESARYWSLMYRDAIRQWSDERKKHADHVPQSLLDDQVELTDTAIKQLAEKMEKLEWELKQAKERESYYLTIIDHYVLLTEILIGQHKVATPVKMERL